MFIQRLKIADDTVDVSRDDDADDDGDDNREVDEDPSRGEEARNAGIWDRKSELMFAAKDDASSYALFIVFPLDGEF